MIKIYILIFTTLLSTNVISQSEEKISDYKYYQIAKDLPKGKDPIFIAYMKLNSPCIFVDDLRTNTTQEYCKLDESGYDLKVDYPSVYPIDLRLSGASLYFIAAAPWNEQECEIFFPEKSITCESTGKN